MYVYVHLAHFCDSDAVESHLTYFSNSCHVKYFIYDRLLLEIGARKIFHDDYNNYFPSFGHFASRYCFTVCVQLQPSYFPDNWESADNFQCKSKGCFSVYMLC